VKIKGERGENYRGWMVGERERKWKRGCFFLLFLSTMGGGGYIWESSWPI